MFANAKNSVHLIGRLTRDPELRYTPSGKAVCNFSLAIPRNYGKDEDTGRFPVDFVDLTAWDQRAEYVANYFEKGHQIAVQGRLESQTWEDSEGKKRTRQYVVTDAISSLEPFSRDEDDEDEKPTRKKAAAKKPSRPEKPAKKAARPEKAAKPKPKARRRDEDEEDEEADYSPFSDEEGDDEEWEDV